MGEPRLPRRAAVQAQGIDPRRLGGRRGVSLAAGAVCSPAPVWRDEEALAQVVIVSARGGQRGREEIHVVRRREYPEVELVSD